MRQNFTQAMQWPDLRQTGSFMGSLQDCHRVLGRLGLKRAGKTKRSKVVNTNPQKIIKQEGRGR